MAEDNITQSERTRLIIRAKKNNERASRLYASSDSLEKQFRELKIVVVENTGVQYDYIHYQLRCSDAIKLNGEDQVKETRRLRRSVYLCCGSLLVISGGANAPVAYSNAKLLSDLMLRVLGG